MSEKDRLEQLIEEARQLSGGKMVLRGLENLPRDVAEQFMKRVIACELEDRAAADGVPSRTNEQVKAKK
jgi:hypothetical protein